MRLLFVDDEPAVLSGLRRLTLARAEWTCAFVASAEAALETLDGSRVDVVITDIRMPGMDGLGLLREMARSHPLVTRVVLSGQVGADLAGPAAELADAWLDKPCELAELDAAVLAGRRRAEGHGSSERRPSA